MALVNFRLYSQIERSYLRDVANGAGYQPLIESDGTMIPNPESRVKFLKGKLRGAMDAWFDNNTENDARPDQATKNSTRNTAKTGSVSDDTDPT
jgi:hypothetical protein